MLEWAAKRPVFANLLMVFLVVAGGLALRFGLVRELFPEFSFDKVVVSLVYPGATPEELEESVTIKVEEAIRGLDGIRLLESTTSEGSASISAEVDARERDPRDVLVDVRNEVSRIDTFPSEVEQPIVRLITNRREAVTVALYGQADERTMHALAREVEQELLHLPEVSEVSLAGLRKVQINIRAREADLQRHGLALDEVSEAIRGASLDLPLGRLRSTGEEQLLRVQSERDVGRELGELPVKTLPDGARVLLREVADIDDGFSEDLERLRISGKPAVTFTIQRTSSQDAVQVADAVKRYLARKQRELPPTLVLEVWSDASEAVVDRLDLLTRNGVQGLVLVFASLLIFLGFRLSFWVAMGLPVAFLSAMVLLLVFGGSLNMISSFALIMILGILVDDSIVVAENIARHMRDGGYTLESALTGLREVVWPVIASVTTTAVAFLPLFYVSGIMGKFIRIMPVAVIACLLASLVECLMILPAHLAHQRPPARGKTLLQRVRARLDEAIERFIHHRYGPTVDLAIRQRYVVAALCAAFLIVVAGMVASGRPKFIFFPRLDANTIQASVTLPQGSSYEATAAVIDRLAQAAERVNEGLPLASDGRPIARRVRARVGGGGAVNTGQVEIELAKSELRDVPHIEVLRRWRELAGPLPEVSKVNFDGTSHRPGGRPLEIRVMPQRTSEAEPIAAALREALLGYPGVFNIDDNLEPGKRELRLRLRREAHGLGLSERDLARQLQAGFLGREAQTLQRGRDEVEVRVRYAREERRHAEQLDDLRLRAQGGRLLPLSWAAKVERGRGLSKIERRDGRRVVVVSADVDDAVTNANEVMRDLWEKQVQALQARFPGAEFGYGGAQEEQGATLRSLLLGFLMALLGIYVILALLFDSYLQPLVVMLAIPVGFGGAILGHVLFGKPLMIFSVFGMVGLTGIVVNDSLVLIDAINRLRRVEGKDAFVAAAEAGRIRFRAVFLTTLTTVAGLLPLLLETSLTAQFIIPMAISIASGVAVATVLTLYGVPCVYLIIEDVRSLFVRRVPLEPQPPAPAPEPVGAGV
ncbi:MAG: efflux RND transporter permease subunit [Planctomycetota bacterium]